MINSVIISRYGKIFNEEIVMDIKAFVSQKENLYFERKSARIKPLETLKHIVGFANSKGGKLVIGVEDNGEITGFNDVHTQIEEFKNALVRLERTPVNPKYEVIDVINSKGQEDQILVVTVSPSRDRVIQSYDGNFYTRYFDETKKLNYNQVMFLKKDRNEYVYEDEIVLGTSIDDVDMEAIDLYREKLDTNLSPSEVLRARDLMVDGALTIAGFLLFGKNQSSRMPHCRLRVIKYDGGVGFTGTGLNMVADRNYDSCIIKIVTDAREYIDTQIRQFTRLASGGQFVTEAEYPEFAWFEGMMNALAHRDYSIWGDYTKFIIYDDHIEIKSPGTFPGEVNAKNIQVTRHSRNFRINRVLTEFEWIKELNEGVRRIFLEMKAANLPNPEYKEYPNSIQLTLRNNIVERRKNYGVKPFSNQKTDIIEGLNPKEKAIFDYISIHKRITRKEAMELTGDTAYKVRGYLQYLINIGAIKWYGSSKTDPTQYYGLE